MCSRASIAALAACWFSASALAADPAQTGFRRGDKGFELGNADGNWFANFDLRMQARYSHFDTDEGADDSAEINRLRLKIGGNVLRPSLTYYLEAELTDPQRLLDLRLTYEASEARRFALASGRFPITGNGWIPRATSSSLTAPS